MRHQYGWAGPLVDLIWPPRSLLSEEIMPAPGLIEPELWAGLTFLTEPWCVSCGFPFELAVANMVCGACAAGPPPFASARAPLRYDQASRPLILRLKHGGRRDGLATFAGWMARAGAAELAAADVIIPVPLHWTRLAQRSFNQAAWLAQALAARSGLPWRAGLLRRVKARRSQGGLSASARRRNVAGVFRASRAVAGKTVLLVDDVFTTGATAAACARALATAGARATHVLTLARVVRPTDATI